MAASFHFNSNYSKVGVRIDMTKKPKARDAPEFFALRPKFEHEGWFL